MPQKTVKVCISYHQRLVADGIASILLRNKKMVLCKIVLNHQAELKKEISVYKPDILILEAEYIGPHFIELLENTRQLFPELKLLVISGVVSHEILTEIMPVIDGYLLRTSDSEKLIFAIHEVMESGKYLCPQLINTLVQKQETENQVNHTLTPREKEVLLLWFRLGSIFQIADKLNISNTTVRTHLKNIRDKLGKPSSAKLIFYACLESHANGNQNPVCPYCKSSCRVLP